MRVQQKVTELAIKGDRALGALRPVEETPAWATFDDETSRPPRNGASAVTELRPLGTPGHGAEDDLPPLVPSAEDVPADVLADAVEAEEVRPRRRRRPSIPTSRRRCPGTTR